MDFHHALFLTVLGRIAIRFWWIPVGVCGIEAMTMLWVGQFSWYPLLATIALAVIASLIAVRGIISKPW